VKNKLDHNWSCDIQDNIADSIKSQAAEMVNFIVWWNAIKISILTNRVVQFNIAHRVLNEIKRGV
jgi:hypothetical protein